MYAQEINEEDEEAFNRFLAVDAKAKRTLADVIFDKITEKQTEVASQMSGKTFGDLLGFSTVHFLNPYF